MGANRKEWKITNRTEDLTRVSREMAEWLEECRFPDPACYAARLAVEEIAGNTIKYGYGEDAAEGTRESSVAATDEGDYLRLDFLDDGFEFNPLLLGDIDVEEVLSEPRDGGLGLALMRQIADRMSYEREGQRNHLTVWILKRDADEADDAAAEGEEEGTEP